MKTKVCLFIAAVAALVAGCATATYVGRCPLDSGVLVVDASALQEPWTYVHKPDGVYMVRKWTCSNFGCGFFCYTTNKTSF